MRLWTAASLLRSAHTLRNSRRGGVAILFAITAIPVAGLIGIAVDIGFISQVKAQLNAAADSAALAAAKTAADAFTAGQSNYIAAGQVAGRQWFDSRTKSITDAAMSAPTITVAQSGAVFTSAVTFKGSVKPFFAPLFGVNTLSLGGTAAATITTTAYVSVTFLLDNSSSMLIAATQAGVDQLNAITPSYNKSMSVPSGLGGLNCAFACHWDSGGKDYYGLARSLKVTLRFDVLQSAVASSITQMITQKVIPDQFSLAIYTFSAGVDGGLTKIYPVAVNQGTSTDLNSGITAAQAFQTPVVEDVPNTDFPSAMAALAKRSTAAGDGSSITNPRKALILVTDGMVDYGDRRVPVRKGPISPADCNAMKNLGYSVYVLYTTYITTPANLLLPFDNIDLLPYINGTATPAMAPSLQSCASSPSNYAEASDPAAINAAMSKMLQSALGNGGRFSK